jgi:hypothetical protein
MKTWHGPWLLPKTSPTTTNRSPNVGGLLAALPAETSLSFTGVIKVCLAINFYPLLFG